MDNRGRFHSKKIAPASAEFSNVEKTGPIARGIAKKTHNETNDRGASRIFTETSRISVGV
jgi:hypothetical protein